VGNARNIAFWVVLLILVMALFQLFSGNSTTMSARSLSYSEFIQRVDAALLDEMTVGPVVVAGGEHDRVSRRFQQRQRCLELLVRARQRGRLRLPVMFARVCLEVAHVHHEREIRGVHGGQHVREVLLLLAGIGHVAHHAELEAAGRHAAGRATGESRSEYQRRQQ